MHPLRSLDIVGKYLLTGIPREPMTMLGTAGLVMSGVGTAIAASNTLASGKAAQASANYTADQVESNASGELASAQRQALERRHAAKLAISASRARAGASGVDPGAGSAFENEGQLAERGEYQALMELWNGQNAATGLRNKANAVRFEGDARRSESKLGAIATLASGGGSMMSSAGKLYFPTTRGSFGAS